MRVLVTGATGFIGRHTVRHLAERGHVVVSSSRALQGPPEAASHLPHDVVSRHPFPDPGPIEAIVHLTGNGNVLEAQRDPAAVALVNVQGTLDVLEVARRAGACVVLASSQRVYRPRAEPLTEWAPTEPTEPYGYTKLAAELFVDMAARLFSVPATVVRLFSVYGPGQVVTSGQSGVVAILGQRAIAGQPLRVLSHQQKDFLDVADAVQALELGIIHAAIPPRTYNIGTGRPTSVLELARLLKHEAASESPIVEDYAEGDPGALVADIHRAQAELGFAPRITLEEGLKRYVAWLRTTRPRSA